MFAAGHSGWPRQRGDYRPGMCGRYTHLFTWKQLHRLLGLTSPEQPMRASYNVAPSQRASVVIAEGDQRRAEEYRWGLVPSWAKDVSIGNRTINARSETVASTPAFRAAFRKRRCIVPITGFYEWQQVAEGKRRLPWYITPVDGELLTLAGLWEEWREAPDAEPLRTFTILTTTANRTIAPIHHRMPVVLEGAAIDEWLDPGVEDVSRLDALLHPARDDQLQMMRVGTWVNAPAHNDAHCIEPAAEEPSADEGGLFGVS